MDDQPFICPECGSGEAGIVAHISPDPRLIGTDPWAGVLETIQCGNCRRNIPAHLAERWNGLSLEEARKEWRKVYRCQRGRPK
jgi:hypothetical protein